ncbi:hypothetical protein GW17_00012227 [Ensete ventricosum]|nr:hypothetical protein GW17_00012227 [Ensete ventricosum]
MLIPQISKRDVQVFNSKDKPQKVTTSLSICIHLSRSLSWDSDGRLMLELTSWWSYSRSDFVDGLEGVAYPRFEDLVWLASVSDASLFASVSFSLLSWLSDRQCLYQGLSRAMGAPRLDSTPPTIKLTIRSEWVPHKGRGGGVSGLGGVNGRERCSGGDERHVSITPGGADSLAGNRFLLTAVKKEEGMLLMARGGGKEEEMESRSGSGPLDGVLSCGEDHDNELQQPPLLPQLQQPAGKKKRYHRHTARQIQEMEA